MATRLRIGEASQRLGLSQDTVREWVRRGFVKARRTPTGQLLFDESDIEAARRGDRANSPAANLTESDIAVLPALEKPAAWKRLPPWETRVQATRAALTLEELEAERKDRVRNRENERKRAVAAAARELQENNQRQRLDRIKHRVSQTVWIPTEHRSEVIASIERFATAEQIPFWLAESEQYDLVAGYVRTRVQELLADGERRSAAERAREEERLRRDLKRQIAEFAAPVASIPSRSRSRPPLKPRTVAEALRQRGIPDP